MMFKLEDFDPTLEELRLTNSMPEQVAIGYVRARRRDRARPAANLLWEIFGGRG